MKTNKQNLKNIEKTGLNIHRSQMLTMNVAQDKDIEYLQLGEVSIQNIIFEIKYRYKPNLQRCSILQNKTKIKHNFHWLKINSWSIKTSSCFKVRYYIFKNFTIENFEIICLRTIQ